MLQFMGSQRVQQDLATKQQQAHFEFAWRWHIPFLLPATPISGGVLWEAVGHLFVQEPGAGGYNLIFPLWAEKGC